MFFLRLPSMVRDLRTVRFLWHGFLDRWWRWGKILDNEKRQDWQPFLSPESCDRSLVLPYLSASYSSRTLSRVVPMWKGRNLMRSKMLAGLVLVCSLEIASGMANAGSVSFTPLVEFKTSGGTEFPPTSAATLGFSFILSEAKVAESLMVWDEGSDGLLGFCLVGLWNSGGTLLASVTIDAGTSNPAIADPSGLGSWRFTTISPLFLNPGTYVVGSLITDSDPVRYGMESSNRTMVSGASYVDGLVDVTGALTFPTEPASTAYGLPNGLFGANIGVQSVPEPASMILTGLSLGGTFLVGVCRKRRKREIPVEDSLRPTA